MSEKSGSKRQDTVPEPLLYPRGSGSSFVSAFYPDGARMFPPSTQGI